jgi:RNA-binding protein
MKNNQKKFLRSLSHDLKATIMIGKNGLTQAVLEELEHTLGIHELVKIKMRYDDKEQKQQIIDKIVEASCSELIQVIGGVMVIYRAFAEEPVIRLPR